MARATEPDKRTYIRIAQTLPVRYRFVSSSRKDKALTQAYNGETRNVSGNGILLAGKLPDPAWVEELLGKKMAIAVSIRVPGVGGPVNAVARAAWINVDMDQKPATCEMGLEFREITQADEQRLLEFIIASLV